VSSDTRPKAAILDATALLALGAGHRGLSRAVALATAGAGTRLYAPAMCVTAAVAARTELADHIGGLLALQVVELGFAGAGAAGELIAGGADWRHAQAIVAAWPSVEWPTGMPVLTAAPDAYAGHHVMTIDLTTL
jgi:hypothetical protein